MRPKRCLGLPALCLMLAGGTTRLDAQQSIPTWSVTASPVLTIEGEGTPETEFTQIRAALRLSSGVIAVANGATSDLRLFDERGRFVRRFGRTGAGPGEFRSLGWVGRSHDTAFVFDHGLRRITPVVLGREPDLLDAVLLTATGQRGRVYVNGRLRNGSWLVQTYTSPGWTGPPGVHRLRASVGVVAKGASGEVEWLGETEGMAIFVHNPTGDIKKASVGPVAFSPDLHAVASGAHVWFGDSSSDSLVVFNSETGTRRVVRLPMSRRSPSRDAIDSARERELATARNDRDREWTNAKFSTARLPRALPFFETMLPGPDGEVWIQEFAASRTDPARYLVMDGGPSPVAWVHVPSGVRIREAGREYLLGVHEDADGVESVRLYGLSRR